MLKDDFRRVAALKNLVTNWRTNAGTYQKITQDKPYKRLQRTKYHGKNVWFTLAMSKKALEEGDIFIESCIMLGCQKEESKLYSLAGKQC